MFGKSLIKRKISLLGYFSTFIAANWYLYPKTSTKFMYMYVRNTKTKTLRMFIGSKSRAVSLITYSLPEECGACLCTQKINWLVRTLCILIACSSLTTNLCQESTLSLATLPHPCTIFRGRAPLNKNWHSLQKSRDAYFAWGATPQLQVTSTVGLQKETLPEKSKTDCIKENTAADEEHQIHLKTIKYWRIDNSDEHLKQ